MTTKFLSIFEYQHSTNHPTPIWKGSMLIYWMLQDIPSESQFYMSCRNRSEPFCGGKQRRCVRSPLKKVALGSEKY